MKYQKKAREFIEKSLVIAKQNLPEESDHLKRLKAKLTRVALR